jgi:hypothetical protein
MLVELGHFESSENSHTLAMYSYVNRIEVSTAGNLKLAALVRKAQHH